MSSSILNGFVTRIVLPALLAGCELTAAVSATQAYGHGVKDLKYGAVLFEFYQKKYFETLVEYDYAAARGGIQHHGDYPELLKGGVSLSYGLDRQAQQIFSRYIAEHSPEEVQNRAWFFLAKMLYLRGDVEASASTLARIDGALPEEIDQEYRYLAALVNIKLGYFDAAESISRTFDHSSSYAPYLQFNLGVALGKEKDYKRALATLKKAASYRDGSSELEGLADRAHMAMAYLDAEQRDYAGADTEIARVRAHGAYSNRALLGAGWVAVNHGAYREALTPLTLLEKRSMVIPEVQEAVLLVPHVYEKLGLLGRAAEGFIHANARYEVALGTLDRARKTLEDADVLELFVRNLDEMLGESDWFGTAPSVSLNALSPFLIDMMSDHSFQSVLKDLRDLYAIRNNLKEWKRKRDDFEVIIAARSRALDTTGRKKALVGYAKEHQDLSARYADLKQRAALLNEDDRERVQWLLNEIRFEIDSAGTMEQQLTEANGVNESTDSYADRVVRNMDALENELQRTEKMIARVENVLLGLVQAELDVHEQRIEYYKIQAQLAKARILDRALSRAEEREPDKAERDDSGRKPADTGSEDDKAAKKEDKQDAV